MPKLTRHVKGNRKNKTLKRRDIFSKKGGDGSDKERKGVIDIASDKITNVTSDVLGKVEDMGLNLLGLERINKSNGDENVVKNDAISSTGVVSNVGSVVNNTSTAVVDNINNALSSQVVNNNVEEAANKTAEVTSKLAEKFNDAMSNPEVKENIEKAIENAAEIGEVIVKSSEKPLKEAVKVGAEAGTKALGAAGAGIIKVGTDMMGAVPGLGAVIELGKMLNDGSKAASAIVEAGSEAVEVTSDAFIETSENVKKGLKELEENKKMAEQISNRTTKSISQFENPLANTSQTGGLHKTRRRLFKRKSKSKRVKFSS